MVNLIGIEDYLQKAEAAKVVAFTGESGVGKSTVLETFAKKYDTKVVHPTGEPYQIVSALVGEDKAKDILQREGLNGYKALFYTSAPGSLLVHAAGETKLDVDIFSSMASAVKDF